MTPPTTFPRIRRTIALTVLMCLVAWAAPSAQVIDLPDFGSSAGLTLNGDAATAASVLRVVPDAGSQSGSAFWSTPLSTLESFETGFRFQISGSLLPGLGSDGMAFVIQADPRGDTALDDGGGVLGYGYEQASGPEITPSAVVEFDIHSNWWDPDDDHVALMLNGEAIEHVASASVVELLDDGDVKNALIAYDADDKQLRVSFSEGADPLVLLFTQPLDLQALVGDEAWFGFSAATGGGHAAHDILDWGMTQGNAWSPWTDVGGGILGSHGVPSLTGEGSLVAGSPTSLHLVNTPPNAPMYLWMSFTSTPTPLFGGVLYTVPIDLEVLLNADAAGGMSLSTVWPAGIPGGFNTWFQCVIQDNTLRPRLSFSNALRLTTP